MAMRHVKCFLPFILLFAIFLLLTGCGSSLQKPTGLEDDANHEQAESSEKTERQHTEDSLQQTDADNDQEKDNEEASTEETEEASSTDQSSNAASKDKTATQDDHASEKQKKSSGSKKEQEKESSSTSKDSSQKETKSEKKQNPPKEKEKKKSPPPKEKNESPPKKEEEKDPPPKEEKPKESTYTITMSMTGPSGKVVMATEEFSIKKETNLFDATKEIGKKKNISIQTTGSGAWGYVEGIGEFREFDYGDESGWLFRVNGIFSNTGAGSYMLQDGDVVEWMYTKDLGKDVGARP